MATLLAPIALLLRLIRPTRGIHVGPWRDGPEPAARVRRYVIEAESERHRERLTLAAHITAQTREAVAEARADRADLIGAGQ